MPPIRRYGSQGRPGPNSGIWGWGVHLCYGLPSPGFPKDGWGVNMCSFFYRVADEKSADAASPDIRR